MTLVWLPSCLVKLYMGFGKYSNSCLTHERRVMDGDVATPGIIAELLSLFPLPIIELPILTNISNQTISRRGDCLENNQTHDNHTRKLSRVKWLDLIMGKFHHGARRKREKRKRFPLAYRNPTTFQTYWGILGKEETKYRRRRKKEERSSEAKT